MINPSIHKKVIGQINITTLVYDKEVFDLIIQKLKFSKIFQSVSVQLIHHHLDSLNKCMCNCNDILTFIAKRFQQDTQRFSQIFVPLVIVSDNSKECRQHLICELTFMHDNLLKTRGDFFVDDVEQINLLKGYSKHTKARKHTNDNCIFHLNEIMSLKKRYSHKHDHKIYIDENQSCLRKVMKKLVSNDLLPLSSKSLPIDSVKLQKVFDICFEHRLPDDMIVAIINSFRKVQSATNQSNNYNGNFNSNSDSVTFKDRSEQTLENLEKFQNSITNNSARRTPDLQAIDQNNISNNSRISIDRKPSQMTQMSTNRPPSVVRTSNNLKTSNRWDNSMRYYEPVSTRIAQQPEMGSLHSKVSTNRLSNPRLSNLPKNKSVKFASERLQSRKIEPRLSFRNNNPGPRGENDIPYEVVIDDECHDLENVEAITVRDSEGNSKVYVECEAQSNYPRQSLKLRPINELPDFRKNNKKVSFLNNNEDDYANCGSTALTRAVLGQEANSMDSLLSILNRKVQQEGDSQCMKLSMRAEHIIRKPECTSDQVYLEEQDGCLTVSSQVQAKWENCICNDDDDGFFTNPYMNKQSKQPIGKMSQNSVEHFNNEGKSIYNPNSLINMNQPLKANLTYQDISNLCDKAIQTEKFLFLETDNERLIISPNPFCPNKGQSKYNSQAVLNSYNGFDQYSFKDSGHDPYYFEDINKRIASNHDHSISGHQQSQSIKQPSYINPYQFYPSGILHPDMHQDQKKSSSMQLSGNYFKDPRSMKSEPRIDNNYSIRDEPYFNNQGYLPNTNIAQNLSNNSIDFQRNFGNFNPHHYSREREISNQRVFPYGESHLQPTIREYPLQIHNQANYSSSASRFRDDNNRRSPEDYIVVESKRLSPIIDIEAGLYCSQTNDSRNMFQIIGNDQKMKTDINLCRYHKFGSNKDRNNSNSRRFTIGEDLCKFKPIDILCDDENTFSAVSSRKSKIIPSRRKYVLSYHTQGRYDPKLHSMSMRKSKKCKCKNNRTISVIPSLKVENDQKQYNGKNEFCLASKNRIEKTNNCDAFSVEGAKVLNYDQIKKYPCLTKVIKKLNSKSFQKEYSDIIELMENNEKKQNIYTKNFKQNNKLNQNQNQDSKNKFNTKISLHSNSYNCSKEQVTTPEMGAYLEPFLDIVNYSFKSFFIS